MNALPSALPRTHGPVPDARQLAHARREFYGFVHFSPNTFTDREWGFGDEDPAAFDPRRFDARQWADAARAAGMTGLILTAKHHDGFCLWPTATTTHSIARSPWRGGQGDVVAEFANACRAAGLAVGLYCSPWDRNSAAYGTPTYPAVYHAQVEELLTRYGELFEFWFDGANGGEGFYGGAREKRSIDRRTYYRFPEVWAQCRRHQPGAILFSDAGPDIRWCGNEQGLGSLTHWAKVRPEGFAVGEVDDHTRLCTGDPDGTVWRPAEVDVSIRPGWFWHPHEQPKTPEHLFRIWLASVGCGSTLLLNLAPDRRGLIPDADVAALRGLRSRIEAFTWHDAARGRPVQAALPGADPQDVGALTDGDAETFWAAPEGATAATLTVDLGRPAAIHGVRLEEAIRFGQRVARFAVDVDCWGSWLEVAHGTTIGAQRILELPPVHGGRLRLRILDSQAAPVLTALKVYAD